MNRPREPPQEEIRMKLTDKENYPFAILYVVRMIRYGRV